jgi:hypothetical protein
MTSLALTASSHADLPWTSVVTSRASARWASRAAAFAACFRSSSAISSGPRRVNFFRYEATMLSSVLTKNW